MIPLPLAVKAKYFVAFLILFSVVASLQERGGVAHLAHLGGLFFGYVFVKLVPTRGFGFELSEGYYAIRNSYHRLRRRIAKRRFQVYMRKHQDDPQQNLNEYDRVNPPDPKDKGDGGWVN